VAPGAPPLGGASLDDDPMGSNDEGNASSAAGLDRLPAAATASAAAAAPGDAPVKDEAPALGEAAMAPPPPVDRGVAEESDEAVVAMVVGRAISAALASVGEPCETDPALATARSPCALMRDRNAKRPFGTSIPVGVEVRVLRPGELKDQKGVVTLARSGYYQVRLPDNQLIFFRGKELWVLADGDPPSPSELQLRMAPGFQRAGHAGSSSNGAAVGPVKSEGGGGVKTERGIRSAALGGGDGEDGPKWWWQSCAAWSRLLDLWAMARPPTPPPPPALLRSLGDRYIAPLVCRWGAVEGSRKRKPTQLCS